MNKLLTLYLFITAALGLQAQQDFKADFDFLWDEVEKNYAYFERQGTDWQAVKNHYRPLTDTVTHPYYFTLYLEAVLRELADSHTHLLTNTDRSQRLLPSGTDMKGGLVDGRYTILEVREGAPAKTIIKPGDVVVSINGIPVSEAAALYSGKFNGESLIALENGFNIALAGDYRSPRTITVIREGKQLELDLGICPYPQNENTLLTSKLLDGNIGYIRIENSLVNTDLITVFNDALNTLINTKALIIDLRNTPSGGDSNVGMPILGRFTSEPKPYQTHYRMAEDKRWTEIVEPRGVTYKKPIYVLVNFWTGSMGEGVTIGLDAFGNATVVGTQMARLLGANYSVSLPNSGYGLNITFEQLFHVNGTPREDFLPEVYLNWNDLNSDGDPWMEKALERIGN
ncbi:S41 family peptidase [Gilvibacter sediminis]|uniref:S41 family peptidase n=1 Tax=Gilvibacter sediminis TaxID=379071 RepID=UPI00234FB75B|nr:S41 family peptidase [Gilvibacter sediminis]MDC7996716.1 S41 family peptidase [Gilvibacter sediminis]